MLDLVVVVIHPRCGLEEAGVRPGGVEEEDPSGPGVNQQAGVPESFQSVPVRTTSWPLQVRPLSVLRRIRRSMGLGRSSRLGRPS